MQLPSLGACTCGLLALGRGCTLFMTLLAMQGDMHHLTSPGQNYRLRGWHDARDTQHQLLLMLQSTQQQLVLTL